jgi:hypothetical protein
MTMTTTTNRMKVAATEASDYAHAADFILKHIVEVDDLTIDGLTAVTRVHAYLASRSDAALELARNLYILSIV